jgi:hypothetical protein
MGWSDYADWSTIDKTRLTAPLDGIIAVIKAVNERCAASGFSLITEIDRLDEIAASIAIQSTVSALITSFVKHPDNGGNWAGLTSIPNWTEADILTAIGDDERIPAPARASELSAEWLYQQYEIINLLLWTNTTESEATVDIAGKTGSTGGFRYPPYEEPYLTIEEAVDIALSDPADQFNGIRNSTWDSVLRYVDYPEIPAQYAGACISGEGRFNFSTILGDSFNSAADVYYLAAPHYIAPHVLSVFDGAGVAEEGMNLIGSLPAQKISSYTTDLIGDKSVFPVYPPAVPWDKNGSCLGWMAAGANFISKFNVSGGFEFVEPNP